MNHIAVIDTGIDIGNKYLQMRQFHGICIKKEGQIADYRIVHTQDEPMCIQDNIGHGTAVSGIILSHNPCADIFVVKLFDWDSLQADEDLICFALEYILKNVDCDLINMSLGICIYENERFRTLCTQLCRANKKIISAFDNNGAISYPAAFDLVLGVTSGDECYRNDELYYVCNSIVNVLAKGGTQRLVWLDSKMRLGAGNSYACAHVTGILSKYSEEENLKTLVEKVAKGIINLPEQSLPKMENPSTQYSRAVIFPFNKEMHSVVRFQNMVSFELVDVYDIRYSGHVGTTTDNLLMDTCAKNYVIRSIDDIDWNSFDTFILGHIDAMLQIIDMPDFKQRLIDQVLSHEKFLYAFDDLSSYNIPPRKNKFVFYPKITAKDVPVSPFGKLYRQGKPVLGIFGTSSRQGKFTLQLKIRKEFLKRGYAVAQIGTEPSSLLFGMDWVFPTGYQSSVGISRKETVVYLNYVLHEIQRKAEIIIVGGQSGTVIRDDGNLDNYNFTQVDFLYATQPDAVVLCVNVNDEMDIIHRTIHFIESATCCSIIALALYPFCYKEESSYQHLMPIQSNEFEEYETKFADEFHLPVYFISNDVHIEYLTDIIIDFFRR